MNLELFAKSNAIFSEDRQYRYSLSRKWNDELPVVLFIGLNPSTADETQDDPTIRRCIAFARDWGYGGIMMVNLFALRATDPAVLKLHCDPVGPENNSWIMRGYFQAERAIAVWGTKGSYRERDEDVRVLIGELYCLGLTKGGYPKHPLYLPKTTKIVPFCDGGVNYDYS